MRRLDRPFDGMLALVGATPMVKLRRVSRGCPSEVWAKLESANPSGSVKDRIAVRMVEEAERSGRLPPGGAVVEPTSGNTGVALAFVCALKGHPMVAVMPEAVSVERRCIVELYGGRVELVRCVDPRRGVTKEDMEGVVRRARELAATIPGAVVLDQFSNEDNVRAHADTTAEEIISQTRGRFAAFVAAVGTGGTFTGVARVLKERCPSVRRVAVEPAGSAVLSGCEPGHHIIQGIGEGFVPEVMDASLVDELVAVTDSDAIATARRLWREEGVMAGPSAGANVFAALAVGSRLPRGSVVVTLIPDSGMRYLSTEELRCGIKAR